MSYDQVISIVWWALFRHVQHTAIL